MRHRIGLVRPHVLGHRGLREDHSACALGARDDRRVLAWHVALPRDRAREAGQARHGERVLDADRQSQQRGVVTRGAAAIGLGGIAQHALVVDRGHRVEPGVDLVQQLELASRELDRGELLGAEPAQPLAGGRFGSAQRRRTYPAASRSQAASVTPRSRSTNFRTFPFSVSGSSSELEVARHGEVREPRLAVPHQLFGLGRGVVARDDEGHDLVLAKLRRHRHDGRGGDVWVADQDLLDTPAEMFSPRRRITCFIRSRKREAPDRGSAPHGRRCGTRGCAKPPDRLLRHPPVPSRERKRLVGAQHELAGVPPGTSSSSSSTIWPRSPASHSPSSPVSACQSRAPIAAYVSVMPNPSGIVMPKRSGQTFPVQLGLRRRRERHAHAVRAVVGPGGRWRRTPSPRAGT